jgi:hypothetical protein
MSVALTDRVLLETWAASREQPPAARAATLLERTLAPAERERLAGWPLARRHAMLLELRIARWGSSLRGVVPCPGCGGEVEVAFDLGALADEVADAPGALEGGAAISIDGLDIRLPTEADVGAAREAEGDGRRALVARCLLGRAGVRDLGEELLGHLGVALADADPVGSAELELACPDCNQCWTQPLGLEDFVALEADADARRIAAEVHALASAYGWSEEGVLAVAPERRRVYLELIH